MRQWLMASTIVLAILDCSSARCATQQDYDECSQTTDAARSIAACARIVGDASESEVDRAAAYVSLGNDSAVKGDLSKAAAMYSLAIQIDPGDVYALAARAVANARLGERERALADYQHGCAADPARLIEITNGSDDLKAVAAAGAECQLPREYGAIVWGWADDGGDYIGMKFGAKTPEEAASVAIARCLAQCRELSPTGACHEGCDESLVRPFGPRECGYVAIGQMSSPVVNSGVGIGYTKEEALKECRSNLAGNYECNEEPVGGCNK
jgi:tetratricopeptide (TPR) repeat protein